MKLSDVVKFRGDLLFNGAVQIDWFESSPDLRDEAVKHFLFHGPEYHGVSQAEITTSEDHALIDTASFTLETLEAINDRDGKDNPFALAIAGYGTGKSHFGLTLSCLLDDPKGEASAIILNNIHSAAPDISQKIRDVLDESEEPYLVIAINGMDNFDLTKELTNQILARLREHGIDTNEVEKLRPRFQTALGILKIISDSVLGELTNSLRLTKDQIENFLNEQDEKVFEQVSSFFEQRNMPIVAVGRESIQELIDVTCDNYCGPDKPFRALVIVFDEFGRYTEFATLKSQIAGSGALQQLFEGIQKNSEKSFFLGLIQFELNAYLERIAPEFKNDIIRVITRYQTARRYFLSVNLETIIAHVIEKKDNEFLDDVFKAVSRQENTEKWISRLAKWFPRVRLHSLWRDKAKFQRVILQGCWPLNPIATWLLYHMTSSGRYLQQRSALAILKRTFDSLEDFDIPENPNWSLPATKLWSNELQEDLLSAEEYGKQGAVAHAYATVYERYSNHLDQAMIESLRAIVLASKMGMTVSSRDEAIEALSIISGLPKDSLSWAVQELQSEYNIIEWDDNFKQFEIIGDAVPRTQFIAFLRSRVGNYDGKHKAEIFSGKAREWSKLLQDDLLQDVDTEFGEDHDITTKEWRFESRCSNIELLQTHIAYAVNKWTKAYGVDEPRGQLIYCYIGQESRIDDIKLLATRYLKYALQKAGVSYAPILIVLLHDIDDKLGQALAEYAVLVDMDDNEKSRFGNFIMGHTQKALESMQSQIRSMILERHYVSCWSNEEIGERIKESATKIFEKIYPKPIPFPFDGFNTARGNAADDCQTFIQELFMGNLDHSWYTSKQPRIKNRADSILNRNWGIFSGDGTVSPVSKNPIIRKIIDSIDSDLPEPKQNETIKAINLGILVKKYCSPPYGGNMASVGLLLGVFVAPRRNDLVVAFNSQDMTLDNWLQNVGVFSGKYLDLDILIKTDIRRIGELPRRQWEKLLAEWEQALSHIQKVEFLVKARELKNDMTIPPDLSWKYEHLSSLSLASNNVLSELSKKEDEEISKLESGCQKQDISLISWAGAELFELQNKMKEESNLWNPEQIDSLEPHIEDAKQNIIQFFDNWITRQGVKIGKPDEVGSFKHRMLELICPNLETLQLSEYAEIIKGRVIKVLRNVDKMVEANRVIMNAKSLVDSNSPLSPLTKVLELEYLIKEAEEHTKKLHSLETIVEIQQLKETLLLISEFSSKCNKLRDIPRKRASAIRDTKIKKYDDIEDILREINALLILFDGKETDIEDLLDIKYFLEIFSKNFHSLNNLELTRYEFETYCGNFKKECINLSEEREVDLPWPIENIYDILQKNIGSLRKEEGKRWLDGINGQISEVTSMSKEDLRMILNRLDVIPSFLTDKQSQDAQAVKEKIERQLSNLEIDWLFEHFIGLPPNAKQEFMRRASELLKD
jgi:hypothetical protein